MVVGWVENMIRALEEETWEKGIGYIENKLIRGGEGGLKYGNPEENVHCTATVYSVQCTPIVFVLNNTRGIYQVLESVSLLLSRY